MPTLTTLETIRKTLAALAARVYASPDSDRLNTEERRKDAASTAGRSTVESQLAEDAARAREHRDLARAERATKSTAKPKTMAQLAAEVYGGEAASEARAEAGVSPIIQSSPRGGR